MTTSRQPSEAYPKSGMCECVRIQLNYLCTCYGELRFDFNFQASLVMHSLVNIHLTVNSYAESKLRKVNLSYYKASGIYIAKNKPLEKVNCEK